METVSLREAAMLAGKTKPTILKRLQKGENDEEGGIKGHQADNGEWKVNIASLSQVYKITPEKLKEFETGSSSQTTSSETVGNTKGNDNLTHELIELRVKVEVQDERLKDKDNVIKSLQADKDNLQGNLDKHLETITSQTLLITAQQQPAPEQPKDSKVIVLGNDNAEPEAVKKPVPYKMIGQGMAAAVVIASLVVIGTMAVVSPEKLAFKNTNEQQAVAAIESDTAMRAIEPAAGSPEEGAQLPFNSLEEDATKK